MSEGVFNVVQLGRETTAGTSVAATTVFPVDSGFLGFELDRASESPEEDFGVAAREYAGRESTGVRWATASLPFVARYQDLVHMLEMHVDTIGTPSGTAGGTCTYPYIYDEATQLLSAGLKPYTLEYGVPGSTQDEWEATGVIANELELGFDALSAPGNSMWKGTAGLVAINRSVASMTGSLSAPTALETIEGHLTTLAEGSVSTAYGSLSALTGSLKQFSFRSNINAVGRVYGGSSDTASAIGRSGKGEIEFDALIGISSTSKTDLHDIYNVSGGLPTERRWRIQASGSGVNQLTIDFRCRFRSVNVGEHEDERLYAVSGVWVYEGSGSSGLSARGKVLVQNALTSIP